MTDNLETANRLLRILAEGCRAHPAYRARRQPGVRGCETCDILYDARQALNALDADADEKAA